MNKKIITMAVLTIMLATMVPVLAGNIQSPVEIPSGGQITTTAAPLEIRFKWELTESDQRCSDIENQTICESKFSCVWNTETCVATLQEGYYMVDDDPAPNLQVMPRPCSADGFNTSLKDVRVYTVVWSPYGITDISNVHIKKFYPNGVEKEEADAMDITGTPGSDGQIDPSIEVEHAIAAAVYYGYITNDQAYDQNTGIIEKIKERQYRVFREIDKMTCCDPAGLYTVNVIATGTRSAHAEYNNTFEYFSIKAIRIDFSNVDYGLIPKGTQADRKIIAGDYAFGSPAPTVRNNGNDPWVLKIAATDLINQQNNNFNITASHLDAWFLGSSINQLKNLPNWQRFDNKVLNACTDSKIDFSVWAPNTALEGTYAGTVYLQPAVINP